MKIIALGDKTPEQAIKDKDHEVILEVDEGYSEAISQGQTAKVMLYFDGSAKGNSNISVRKARSMINAYSSGIGAIRLQLRGVSPNIMQAIAIEDHDQASVQSKGAQTMLFLPYFLILILFSGSMYLALLR